METIAEVFEKMKEKPKNSLSNFIEFLRTQGVVGLAIGFILGGAVSKIVSSFVENVINPLVGLLLGHVDLADKVLTFGQVTLKYGAFITSLIDFIIIAAVVYFGFKMIGIERLDKKKEE